MDVDIQKRSAASGATHVTMTFQSQDPSQVVSRILSKRRICDQLTSFEIAYMYRNKELLRARRSTSRRATLIAPSLTMLFQYIRKTALFQEKSICEKNFCKNQKSSIQCVKNPRTNDQVLNVPEDGAAKITEGIADSIVVNVQANNIKEANADAPTGADRGRHIFAPTSEIRIKSFIIL